MRWPDADLAGMTSGHGYYRGQAICRRGHVETQYLDPTREPRDVPANCLTCGAKVLTACPQCQLRIRGKRHTVGAVVAGAVPRPSFCDGCGGAYPWATRDERIYELENLLDEEDVDEADRVVIQDTLERLRTQTLSEKEERQAWESIKQRSGQAIKAGPVQRVLEGLVSAGVRASLGL